MESPRTLLPAANGKGTCIRLQVEILVGVAQGCEVGVKRQGFLGQKILVLHNARRQGNACHIAHALGPQARTVHQNIAGDITPIGDNAKRPPALQHNLLDANPFLDLYTIRPRALGIGHGQRIGIDVAVTRNKGGTLDTVGRDIGKKFLGFRRRK
jgi:hypothetical protein